MFPPHKDQSSDQNLNLFLGRAAEGWIAHQLKAKDWEILERNWTRRGTEIDIIAKKDERILFVEVKFREVSIEPHNLLSKKKLRAFRYGIHSYLLSYPQSFRSILTRLALVTPCDMSFKAQWWPLDEFY